MQRSLNFAGQLVKRRGFSTNSEKIVAAVLFERLPVVIPKIDPVIYAFTDFQYVVFACVFFFLLKELLYLDLVFIGIGSISYLFLILIVQLCSIVFRFRWQQQYRRKYPDEFLNKADGRYIFYHFVWLRQV